MPAVLQVVQSLHHQSRIAKQVARGPQQVALTSRLEDADDLHSCFVHVLGGDHQQRSAADDHDALARPHLSALYLRLHAAEAHHARQRPSVERLGTLVAAGAEDQETVVVRAERAVLRQGELVPFRHDADDLAAERRRDPCALAIERGAQRARDRRTPSAGRRPRGVGRSMHNTADLTAAVDDGGTYAVTRELDRGAQAGRPRADDRDAVLSARHRHRRRGMPPAVRPAGRRGSRRCGSTCRPAP